MVVSIWSPDTAVGRGECEAAHIHMHKRAHTTPTWEMTALVFPSAAPISKTRCPSRMWSSGGMRVGVGVWVWVRVRGFVSLGGLVGG